MVDDLKSYFLAPDMAPLHPSAEGRTRSKLIPFESFWGSTWKTGLGTNVSLRELAENFYAKNTLVYACVEELATSAAEPRLIVERKVKDGWEEWEDCPLQGLLDNPSKQAPKMTAYYMHYGIMMYEAIYGNAFLEKVRSKAGRVVALVPINPERMAYKLTADNTRLDHWDCAMGQGQTIPLLPEDIIHFRKPNPRNPLMGMSPLSVCLRMAGIDNNQADFVAAFFENAAVPFGLLQHKERLDDAEVARIRERVHEQYQGISGWHDIMILDTEASYQSIGQGLDHIDVGKISALPETRICMAFQVPAALVGALVGLEHGTNQATLRDYRRSFWEETLGPIYKGHADQWNLDLVPEFGDNLRVRWDFSKVSALQENETEKHNRARADLQAGYILVDEARQAIGLDVIPNGRGQVFLRPLNIMEIAQTQKAKVIGVHEPYQLKAGEPDRNLNYWKSLDATAKAWEKPFQREAASQFRSELEGLMAILRKEGKAAKISVPFQLYLLSALDFLKAQGAEWRKGFYPLFEALLTAQGENIAARFGISFDIDSPAVQEFLGGYTMRFSEKLFDVDEKAINSLVSIAQSEGWSVPQLRDAITDEWGGFAKDRAEMIARTETIRSSNAGAKEAMRQAGIKKIRWLAASDDRTCDWCLDLDGKVIDIEGNFFDRGDQYTVQGEDGNEHTMTLDYEDVGYPPLHADCRCTTVAELED